MYVRLLISVPFWGMALFRGSSLQEGHFYSNFQNASSGRFFVTKIEYHYMNLIFCTTTWGPMNNCLYVEMQLATRIGIHHRLFCGGNFVSKNFKFYFWCSQFSQDYGSQSSNSTKLCHGWFHESVLKYLHQKPSPIFRKTVYSGISDYRTKNFTADTGTYPERKECSKTSKIT